LVEPDRSVEQIQARGLEYVHFERVGHRTFTSTSTLNAGSLSSSSTFFCTFGSSPRIDRGRRVGPGVRTLKLTVSAIFATSTFFSIFVHYNSTVIISFSVCSYVWFFFVLFSSFVVVGSVLNLLYPCAVESTVLQESSAGLPTGEF
jgi:hypothetical protein